MTASFVASWHLPVHCETKCLTSTIPRPVFRPFQWRRSTAHSSNTNIHTKPPASKNLQAGFASAAMGQELECDRLREPPRDMGPTVLQMESYVHYVNNSLGRHFALNYLINPRAPHVLTCHRRHRWSSRYLPGMLAPGAGGPPQGSPATNIEFNSCVLSQMKLAGILPHLHS